MYFRAKHGGWGGGQGMGVRLPGGLPHQCRVDCASGRSCVCLGARRVKNVLRVDWCSDTFVPFIISIYFMLGEYILCIGWV